MYHNENDYTFVWIASLKQWPRILFSKFSQAFFRRRRIFSVTYHNRKDLVTFCINKQTYGLPSHHSGHKCFVPTFPCYLQRGKNALAINRCPKLGNSLQLGEQVLSGERLPPLGATRNTYSVINK